MFEVLSPTSGRVDRISKRIEYRTVPPIRRDVIHEYRSADLTVSVQEFYEDMDLPAG